jgi:predicted P-loop ATPase/GTPase
MEQKNIIQKPMSDKKETPVSWLVEQLHKPIVPKELLVLEALKMESKKQQKYDKMLEMLEKIIKYSLTRAIEAEAEQLIKEAKEL